MNNRILLFLILILNGCSIDESVKIAIDKEAEAITAVRNDYQTSVEKYNSELLNQTYSQLDIIFEYETKKEEASGKLTADKVIQLDKIRSKQREQLKQQADAQKQKYLNSQNLLILESLHKKIVEYIKSERFTTSDATALAAGIESEIDKIRNTKK